MFISDLRTKCRNGCIYLFVHTFILVSLFFSNVPTSDSGSKLVDFVVEGLASIIQGILFLAILLNPFSVFFTFYALTSLATYGILNHKQKNGENINQYEQTVNDVLVAVPLMGIVLTVLIVLLILMPVN